MKWKNRLTNYNFWISIVSAVLLILQAFKFQFDIAYINEIATAVLGLLVVIGIISDPTKTYVQEQTSAKDVNNQEKKEEKPCSEEKTAEAIQLPIEIKNENSFDNVKDDFQDIINKITADIKENFVKINEIQSAILNEINSSSKKSENASVEPMGENNQNEVVEEATCFNIVNN